MLEQLHHPRLLDCEHVIGAADDVVVGERDDVLDEVRARSGATRLCQA